MNNINNNYNINKIKNQEVENKLKSFQEGADYSVLRENDKNIYNFHSDILKSMFGTRQWTTVYEAAESWDSDNFSYRRENAEYASKNGGKITYSYEHKINKNSDYSREFIITNKWENPRSQRLGENPSESLTLRGDYPQNSEVEWHRENLRELYQKRENCKDRIVGMRDHILTAHPIEDKKGREHAKEIHNDKKTLQEVEKLIREEESWLDKNTHSYNSNELVQENNELRKQLVELQKQLAEIAAELKKLKGQESKKFAVELAQVQENNEMLTRNSGKVSATEVAEQVNRTRELAEKVNASQVGVMSASAPTNDLGQTDNSRALPYAIGGALLVGLTLIFGYYVVNRKKNK